MQRSGFLQQRDELAEVVDTGRWDTGTCQSCLEQLLDGLLSMEAEDIIGDIVIVKELFEGYLVAAGLPCEACGEVVDLTLGRGHGLL